MNGIPVANADNSSYVANKEGKFTVLVTNNGCSLLSDEVDIEVNPMPVVNLGNDTTLQAYQFIILNAGLGYDEYLWSTGSTSHNLVVDSNGVGLGVKSIWVKVTDNNCMAQDDINITFVRPDGIEETQTHDFVVFPNPGKGIFNVEFKGSANLNIENVMIQVLDLNGKIILEENLNTLKTANSNYSFDISDEAKGMYLFKIIGENFVSMKQIIKQ